MSNHRRGKLRKKFGCTCRCLCGESARLRNSRKAALLVLHLATSFSSSFRTCTSHTSLAQTSSTAHSKTSSPFLIRQRSCPAITPISSCAARHPASRWAASATNATANAPSATPTCGPPPSCASATNAPSETTRTNVSCAAAKASVMHSTASNARDWKRIEMDVPRSSISGLREPIYFIKRKTSGTSIERGALFLLFLIQFFAEQMTARP